MTDRWPRRALILVEGTEEGGDFGRSFAAGLRGQDCQVTFTERTAAWPNDFDLLLAYGPFSLAGSMLPIGRRLLSLPSHRRPTFVWWFTEGMPDRRIPTRWLKGLARARLAIDQHLHRGASSVTVGSDAVWFRGHRLRILGELRWFQERGLLNTLVVTSTARAARLQRLGFQSVVVSLGYHPECYGSDLGLDRDIPVAFLGQMTGWRRRRLLDRIIADLGRHHVPVAVHTHLYGEQRTALLNRTIILLNILRAPQDFVGQRLVQAAANKALMVSEPMADCAPFLTDQHFVAAPIDRLAETIRLYLQDDAKRFRITEEAYRFVTRELTIEQMMARILDHLRARRLDAA